HWDVPHQGRILTIAYSPKETLWFIFYDSGDSHLYRWGLGDPRPRRVWSIPDAHFHSLRVPDEHELVAIGGLSGREEVWKWDDSCKRLRKHIGRLGGALSVAQPDQSPTYFLAYRHRGYDLARSTPLSAEIPPPSAEARGRVS